MKTEIKGILMAIFIGILIYLVGLGYINSHEFIHQQIYSRHDVSSYSIVDYKRLSGFTLPAEEEIYRCNDFCKLQHGLNDIIGYNLAIFVFNSWALLVTYLFYRRFYGTEK